VAPPSVRLLAAQELERLVSRLRSVGAARLALPAAEPFSSRVDAVHHLVRELVELSGEGHGYPDRLGAALLGDQLAVVGGDALRALSSRPDSEALFVLGELVLHRFDVDGTLPKGDVAATLGAGDLLARLRSRCPAG
jgi:hypothetical protein